MKILVISDIHEHFDNLQKVLDKIPELGVERIFCLGDIINGGIGQKKLVENTNHCLCVNPGDICGSKTGLGSYAVYDTESNMAQIFDIVEGYGVKNLVSL